MFVHAKSGNKIPAHIQGLLLGASVSNKRHDRLFTLATANNHDRAHGTELAQIVLARFMRQSGHRLLAPREEASKTEYIVGVKGLALVVRDVSLALGPVLGPKTTIGELVVNGSNTMYVTDNFSTEEGFRVLEPDFDEPTKEEPYLIVHEGGHDRRANLSAALHSVVYGPSII